MLYILFYNVDKSGRTHEEVHYIHAGSDDDAKTEANAQLDAEPNQSNARLYGPLPEISLV